MLFKLHFIDQNTELLILTQEKAGEDIRGYSIRSGRDTKTLLRESEALFWMIDVCWCWLVVRKWYCNIPKRSWSKSDVWLFKINVFRTGHFMEWPQGIPITQSPYIINASLKWSNWHFKVLSLIDTQSWGEGLRGHSTTYSNPLLYWIEWRYSNHLPPHLIVRKYTIHFRNSVWWLIQI